MFYRKMLVRQKEPTKSVVAGAVRSRLIAALKQAEKGMVTATGRRMLKHLVVELTLENRAFIDRLGKWDIRLR